MPREQRVITFTADEALKALRQYAQVVENRPFPADPAERLAIEPGAAAAAEIVSANGAAGSTRHVFAGERLVQALTFYCTSIRIPLPRRAEKIVQLRSGELQLVITLDAGNERLQLVADAA